MIHILSGAAVYLALLSFFTLYRAYAGPKAAERVVAINVLTTKVTMLIALLSIITGQEVFVDVALIYAMMGFIATISVSKYVEKGTLS